MLLQRLTLTLHVIRSHYTKITKTELIGKIMPTKEPLPVLPFDEGSAAYLARKHDGQNPYPENAWQHNECVAGME
jgi:hypothetical protein